MSAVPSIITIEDANARLAGLVTYWTCHGEVRRELLQDAFTAAGLPADALPAMPRPATLLARAVKDLEERHRLVRHLGDGRYAIVQEHTEEARYTTLATIDIEGDGWAINPHDSVLYDQMAEHVARQRSVLQATDISGWLVDSAVTRQAVALRASGGVYFLPRGNLDAWRKLTTALGAAQAATVFAIPAVRSDDAVEAVLAALKDDVEAAVAITRGDLSDVGPRALKTRRKQAEALAEKVAHYEQVLDAAQPSLRASIAQLQAEVSAAILLAEQDA